MDTANNATAAVLTSPIGLAITPAGIVANALWSQQINNAEEAAINWWKGTPGNPTPPPAPAAPQTPDQMTTWTPEDQATAYQSVYGGWSANSIPDPTPGALDNLKNALPDPSKILYDVAIGVTVILAATFALKALGHKR